MEKQDCQILMRSNLWWAMERCTISVARAIQHISDCIMRVFQAVRSMATEMVVTYDRHRIFTVFCMVLSTSDVVQPQHNDGENNAHTLFGGPQSTADTEPTTHMSNSLLCNAETSYTELSGDGRRHNFAGFLLEDTKMHTASSTLAFSSCVATAPSHDLKTSRERAL